METNGLSGGMFPNLGSGMLGLEMSLHHPNRHQSPQNPHHLQQQQQQQHHHHHHQPMVAYGHHEADHHHDPPRTQQSSKQACPSFAPKSRPQQLSLGGDEDEAGLAGEDSAGDGKRKMSPWQRMKWTDSMIRLLIMVVFYIEDETGSEGNDPNGKKKGGGVLQKKGKWKSVSRAMLERGFYVSPQQCEDKFNDLNKRYKRVNDILGRGTACKVVENQSLLETMDHLSPKAKEEVKKLLNSKHLFFREMCAYHNSCGGGNGNGGGGAALGAHHSPDMAAEPSQVQQQQHCFHSPENALVVPGSGRAGTEGLKVSKGGNGEEEEEDEDDNDADEDDDDDEDEMAAEGGSRGSGGGGHEHRHGHEGEEDERSLRKRPRKGLFSPSSPLVQQLNSELVNLVQDGTKSPWEKRHWMTTRLMQLEEQKVGFHYEAFELEKQRLKWIKFCSKKEREMEREKLKNERMKLEVERMVLLLRQKELELFDLQHNSTNKRSDPSSITG